MRCPICNKIFSPDDPTVALPFCSERCKRIDLGRWMNEEYSVDTVNLDKLEEAIAGVEEEKAQEERWEDDGPN